MQNACQLLYRSTFFFSHLVTPLLLNDIFISYLLLFFNTSFLPNPILFDSAILSQFRDSLECLLISLYKSISKVSLFDDIEMGVCIGSATNIFID